MIRYFDAFLCKHLDTIQLNADEWGLYAAGRGNVFGTTLAARGTKEEIETEYARCRGG